MVNSYGISDAELSSIKAQTARRVELRKEFLKQKTNPWKHAAEAGYVFDPALQKFMTLKVTQFERFQSNTRTGLFGICAVIIPFFAYGYLVVNHRNNREQQIRSGELKYKDRMFKLA